MTSETYNSDDDVLRSYLTDIRKTPLLSSEEEKALARRIQKGDTEAFHCLVKANLRFVVNVVKKYRRSGAHLVDLINEGNIGLMRAAKKYNPNLGLRFISYAVWWIRNRLSLYLAKNGGVLAVPARKISLIYQLEATYQRLFESLKRVPSPEELGKALEMSSIEVMNITSAIKGCISIEKLLCVDGGSNLEGVLASSDMAVPEQHLSFLAFMERLHFLMVSLKLKEKRALILYHGLEGEKCCETFAEVGRQMGVSRESARLLYHRAIKKLAEHSDIDMLKDYWYFTS